MSRRKWGKRMTLEEAIKHAEEIADGHDRIKQIKAVTLEECKCASEHRQLAEWLKELKQLREQTRWIPVKWHEITDEERKENDYPKEWACYFDSIMPYDGQRILITTKSGYVELDECYSDDGQTLSLDSGYDWVDDVIAWMPLPKPHKAESEG